VRPQTGQGLALDEVEKLAAKLSPVGYDVVMNLILTAWVSMNPKTAARSQIGSSGFWRL